jgi:hypothetical protein
VSAAFDDVLAARFATLAADPGPSDWLDVQRRARRLRTKRLLTYAIAAMVGVILVGCTTALGPRVVDFFAAEPSPPHVIDFLSVVETANIYADPSFPGFDPKQTRRIMDGNFASGTIQLDLTPLRGGGFCLTMRRTSATGDGDLTGCTTPARQGKEPLFLQEPDGRVNVGSRVIGSHGSGATSLSGWVTAPDFADLSLRYEDGSTVGVPHFHVTAPIDADFFLFDVPAAHERHPRRAVELRAADGDGKVIATIPIYNTDPDEWTFPHYGGKEHHPFPPAADASRERKLVFPGTEARIWVAPAKGGVRCFIFHTHERNGAGSDACLRDDATRRQSALDEDSFFPGPGAGPSHPVLLWGLVEPQVRRVELHFQDGTTRVTVPQEGFVLYSVPRRQYPAGKRLLAALLRDSGGRLVRRIAFDPTTRDLYPCENPRDPGIGAQVCP